MRSKVSRLLPLVLLGLSAAALAGGLPKLPKEAALPQGTDSPGVVAFRHESHVDAARPDCTGCHPGTFRILKSTKAKPITHADMEKGRACGSCHDGKAAFGLADDCAACHKG